MKITILLNVFLLVSALSFSQDYKNVLVEHTVATNTTINPGDIETIPGQVITTGIYAPLPFDIPGINNISKQSRIFLDDYISGSMLFKKAYLINGIDINNINTQYSYKVNEVKYDGTGYVICGNIIYKNIFTNFNEGFVLKVGLMGNYLWCNRYAIPLSKSVWFNSIQPIMTGSILSGYVTCGYRIEGINTKRAIVLKLDTVGNVSTPALQVNQPIISGQSQHSEFKKVILYANKDFAIVGTCGQIKDSCGKNKQSNVLFGIYNSNYNAIFSKDIGTLPNAIFDYQSDEGVSLVKADSGIIILSKYYNSNGVPCTMTPDYQGHLIRVVTPMPNNTTTWQLLKSIKFNPKQLASTDLVQDLLYINASGTNLHTWVYSGYDMNQGILLKVNMSNATNLMVPKILNNNPVGTQMECKTIDYNTSGNVVGLTGLFNSKFSIFEITNASNANCISDSTQVNYIVDSLSWNNIAYNTLNVTKILFPHLDYNISVVDTFACDTVSARHTVSQVNLSIEQITVFPNPIQNSAIIEIESNTDKQAQIYITDITGKIILNIASNKTLFKGYNQVELSLDGVKSGIYFAVIEIERKKKVIKLLKK